ncbi:ankyrin repeat protein, putative, partial [Bodo saltans]
GKHGHSHGGGGQCGGGGGGGPQEPVSVESACGTGDLAQVILFHVQGVEVAQRLQPYGGVEAPPLMWAALKGHLPIVKFLIDRGADIHRSTADGQNALHWAATESRYEVVDALLQLGARPTDMDVRGYNSYFVAVQASNLATLALLVQAEKPDPAMRDSEQHTLMHWAAYRGSLALCQYVHEVLGVTIDAIDNQKRSLRQSLATKWWTHFFSSVLGPPTWTFADTIHTSWPCKPPTLATLALLVQAEKPDPAMRDSEQHTLMHWAAYRGSLALCQYVHEVLGVTIDAIDNQKRSALHWAAREGHEEVCAYLLSKGARPTLVDADDLTPVAHATDRNQRNAVLVLTQNIHEVATRRRAGTLSLMILDRAALLSGLFGVGYIIIAFAAMLFIPPVFAHMAFGLYFGKNLLFTVLYRMPPNHRSQGSDQNDFRKIATASGIPQTFGEAVQSLDYVLRRREPANVFAILTFFAVQNVSLLTAQIDLGLSYWALLVATLATMALTKVTALKSVMTSGSIHDSAIVRFVKEKKFKMLQPRLVDQEKHIQLPLRAFYCFEIDEIPYAAESPLPRQRPERLPQDCHSERHSSDIRGGGAVIGLCSPSSEPANVFAILTFFAVQNVSLLTAQIDLGLSYWALLVATLATMALTKVTALKSVMTAGSIHDSAIVRFVKEKKFKMLQPRLVDQEKHIQLPLRAFYCFEIDEIVKLYDSYSVAIDAPIGEANLHWFSLFVISFTLMQLTVFLSSFEQLSERFCNVQPPRSGALWGFVFHALPCAIAPVDDSWMHFLLPSSLNSAGVWIIDFSLAAFVMGLIVCGRTIFPFAYGCTRKELINPTVPTQEGDLVPLIRGMKAIFAEGGAFTNLLFMFTGRFGQRWRGLYAVPTPPSVN